jgi:hypothetical protein
VLVLNLAPQPGETAGFSPEEHLAVLAAHAPRLRLDVVVADPAAVPEPDLLRRGAEALGAETLLAPVGDPDGTPRHDPVALAAALAEAAHHRAGTGNSGHVRPDPSPWGATGWSSTGPTGPAVNGSSGPRDPHDLRPRQEEDLRWP